MIADRLNMLYLLGRRIKIDLSLSNCLDKKLARGIMVCVAEAVWLINRFLAQT